MAESLFTTQTPVAADQSDGGPGITVADSFVFATAGYVLGIRFYATATVSAATYTAELWQQTSPDDVAATGTRVGVKAVSITPTASAWNEILFDSPVAVVAGGQVYRPAVHNPARYVATNGAFTAAGITNGNLTAPQASAGTRNGTFRIGASANVYPSTAGADANYFVDVLFVTHLPRRRRTVTAYIRGTEGRLNDILTTLGTTTPSLWPFWEPTGTLVTGISVGDLIPSETAGAAEALEDDFSPVLLPSGLYAYHFHPTGDHHLAGIDHANFSFGNGTADTPFSVGAWIRPNAIVTNVIMGKYDSAGNAEEWRFFIDSAGLLSLELHDASASATEIAVSTSALTIGQWVFVVASYDGGETTPVVNLYVNKTLSNDGTTAESGSYVAMENTASPLTIGCSGVTATPVAEFHGRIALPFITGKALTTAEVETLYGYTAPLVGVS